LKLEAHPILQAYNLRYIPKPAHEIAISLSEIAKKSNVYH
jgi:hypothetical protein